jgi:putative ABC transport system permease protein
MLNDLRFAARLFARNRAFSTTSVLTLALGIGLTTCVFSIVDGVLFRPLPYDEPDRLFVLSGAQRMAQQPQTRMALSLPEFRDWQRSRSFEQLAAFETGQGPRSQVRGLEESIEVVTASISEKFLDVLGIQPALGRTFAGEEYGSSPPSVALITDGLWRRAFGADRNVIGKTMIRGEHTLAVVGVLPRRFVFPTSHRRFHPDVLIPTLASAKLSASRNYRFLTVIGQLAPDVSLEQARAEMDSIAAQIAPLYVPGKGPTDRAFDGVTITPLADDLTKSSRTVLRLVFAAVVTLFALACVNVVSLLLARRADRVRELAIRTAIGAGRFRIARQLVMETALLATAAGILGWIIAQVTFDVVVSRIPAWLQLVGEPRMELRALVLTIGASMATVLACGVLPAVVSTRDVAGGTLLREGRHTSGRAGKWMLVAGEIALAMILLAAGAIMLHGWVRLQSEEIGVDGSRIMVVRSVPGGPFDATARMLYRGRLFDALRRLPGAEAVAFTDAPLLSRAMRGSRFIPPFEVRGPEGMDTDLLVSPGYFAVMGIPIRIGRALTDADRDRGVVISETAARRYWPGRNPVGETIRYGKETRQIVGVAADVRDYSMDLPATSTLYHVWTDSPPGLTATMVVRFSGEAPAFTGRVRAAVQSIDEGAIIGTLGTFDDLLGRSVAERRFNTVLLGTFAAAGLIIALVGVYGIVGIQVAQRRREMGIRAALGASPQRLKSLVVGGALRPVCAGLVAGTAGALLLARYLRPFVYAIEPTDPATLCVVGILFAGVALAASYFPARRAAAVDPIMVLRAE